MTARLIDNARVLVSNRDWCLGTVGSLAVAHWIGHTYIPSVIALGDLVKTMSAQHPKGVGLIQVIAGTAVSPDAEARRLLAELLKAGSGRIQSSSIVVPGNSFRTAAGRALVATLALLARPSFKHVVHATVRETVQWHHGILTAAGARSFDINEATDAIEALPTLK